ncbi:MAG: hypothetical protein ACE5PV_01580 [Candidatus Poribacteria bacterium]
MLQVENSPNLSPSNKRKNIPDGLWNRCEVCGEITFSKELDRNLKICPKCGYHYPMSPGERIRMLTASKNFTEYKSTIKIPSQTFEFSSPELVTAGEARLHEYRIVLCIINLPSIDGSNVQFNLNKTEYNKILYAFNQSLMESLPLITFYADGTIVNLKSEYTKDVGKSEVSRGDFKGLRFSNLPATISTSSSLTFLINLAATVEKLSKKRIPHVTVLTNPRAGSEFCTSFPLGDIVLAEPKNLKSTDNKKNNHKAKSPRPSRDKSASEANIITQNARFSSLRLSTGNYLIDRYVNRRNLKKNLMKILSFCIG